jgi:3-phosphoglycerate kinase
LRLVARVGDSVAAAALSKPLAKRQRANAVSHVSTSGGGVATLELFWRAAVKAIANFARV